MGYTALTAFLDDLEECTDHEVWVKRMYFGPWKDLGVPEAISDHLVRMLRLAAEKGAEQAVLDERLRVAREEAQT